MNRSSFDTLTRRASLLTMGGAGLAALSPRIDTLAGSRKHKRCKCRKKCKERQCEEKDCQDLCTKQAEQCRRFENAFCRQVPPEVCAARLSCCTEVEACRTLEHLLCLQRTVN